MARQLLGKSIDVVVFDAPPTSADDGTSTLEIADTTASFGRVRPETVALFVELTGAGSLELVFWARGDTQDHPALGWARLYDTGNPGIVGGGPLPAPGKYMFVVNNAMIFSEVALVKQSVVNTAAVAQAVLIENAETVMAK